MRKHMLASLRRRTYDRQEGGGQWGVPEGERLPGVSGRALLLAGDRRESAHRA
jgi:hypothetical protein